MGDLKKTYALDGNRQQMGSSHYEHPNLFPLHPALSRGRPTPPLPDLQTPHTTRMGPKYRQTPVTTDSYQRIRPNLQQLVPKIRRCKFLSNRSRACIAYYCRSCFCFAAKSAKYARYSMLYLRYVGFWSWSYHGYLFFEERSKVDQLVSLP